MHEVNYFFLSFVHQVCQDVLTDRCVLVLIRYIIVKSVDLDSWTVEQVENMIKWGNEKVNMYWEARLPERNIPNESYVDCARKEANGQVTTGSLSHSCQPN